MARGLAFVSEAVLASLLEAELGAASAGLSGETSARTSAGAWERMMEPVSGLEQERQSGTGSAPAKARMLAGASAPQ